MAGSVERLAPVVVFTVVSCVTLAPAVKADDAPPPATTNHTALSRFSASAAALGNSGTLAWESVATSNSDASADAQAGAKPQAPVEKSKATNPAPVARKIRGRPLKPIPGLAAAPVVQPAKVPASWPTTIAEDKAAKERAAQPAAAWSQDEINEALAHCKQVLKGTHAVVIPQSPIREGECGAPAPVQLVSVGRNPQVALSPPVTVTCDLAAEVDKWVKGKLQPIARKYYGQPLIKIETMSSYSCRNAYGRAHTKLSEHARANAIDIRGFTTQSGKSATVLAGWGMTEREIKARIAAAKAAQEKLDAKKGSQRVLQANAARTAPAATPAPTPTPEPQISAASMMANLPKVRIGLPGNDTNTITTFSLNDEPQKLGGPKPAVAASEPGVPMNANDPAGVAGLFLRAAHDSACESFGTTLGPEANKAHRNHLHIDMAKRGKIKICE
jgi:hypothetical protein